jgi:hypothetical protein
MHARLPGANAAHAAAAAAIDGYRRATYPLAAARRARVRGVALSGPGARAAFLDVVGPRVVDPGGIFGFARVVRARRIVGTGGVSGLSGVRAFLAGFGRGAVVRIAGCRASDLAVSALGRERAPAARDREGCCDRERAKPFAHTKK